MDPSLISLLCLQGILLPSKTPLLFLKRCPSKPRPFASPDTRIWSTGPQIPTQGAPSPGGAVVNITCALPPLESCHPSRMLSLCFTPALGWASELVFTSPTYTESEVCNFLSLMCRSGLFLVLVEARTITTQILNFCLGLFFSYPFTMDF